MSVFAGSSGIVRIGPRGGISVGRFAGMGMGAWFNSPAFSDAAAVADFNNDRYAITEVAVGSVSGATAAALRVKRACTFAEFFAFTASSTTARTYVGSGNLVSSDLAVDQPRFDWLNGKRQLNLEAAQTNLLLQSDNLSIAPWGNEGTPTTTASAGTSPSGANDAVSVNDTNGAATEARAQNVTVANDSSSYVASCFIKAGTSSVASLRFGFTGGTPTFCEGVIDLATGLAQWRTGQTGAAFKVEAFANGWYRLSVAFANNTSGNTTAQLILRPAFASTYSPTNGVAATGSALFWGADLILDASTQPTSHISTAGSSVTRAIESARFSPTLEAVMQRASFGVAVRGQNLLKSGGRVVGVGGGGPVIRSGSTRLVTLTDEPSQLITGNGADMRSNTWAAAAGFSGSGRSVIRNGVAVATDAIVTTLNRSLVYLGRDQLSTADFYGDARYDSLLIFPERPSDARLAELVA